jgi:RNA polymerase sigma-70 factor (ECF subfamily)
MNQPFVEQLRRFYEGNRQELFTYSLAVTRNREAAEDAIQNAFQRLLGRSSLPDDLRPYVFRCVRNAAIDDARRAKVQEGDLFVAPDECAIDSNLRGELNALFDQLSNDERETIVLKVFDGMTFQEIANVREVSINTIASWYRRGMEKLRSLWMEEVK